MPKRLTVQQLDHIMKNDPQRGLNIIEQRAERRLTSPSPASRVAGQVAQDLVAQARERNRSQKSR